MANVSRTSVVARRRTHRTHEERSTATKEALIDAAIKCLHKYGYGATTTGVVAEEAGFSRGAMLHHFGTKVDLMLAVAETVLQRQDAYYAEALKRYPPGKERFLALTELTWELTSQPAAMALLEIMMASRSDLELGRRFPGVANKFARVQNTGAWEAAQAAGIKDRERIEAMSQLHRAAMQGLSIQLMFAREAGVVDKSLDLLKWYKAMLTEDLIEKAKDGQ